MRTLANQRLASAAARACIAGMSLAIAATAPAAHEIELRDLTIVHPYTFELSRTESADTPVFMTIHNHGSVPDRLLAASSPLAERAEIGAPQGEHPERGIALEPGGTVTLTAQGSHITLVGMKESLSGYETFPLWLEFERAGKVEVEVMVEER